MPIDLSALKAALETDLRYDAAVRAGRNMGLLTLLIETETGQTVYQAVPKDEVLEAIGDGVRGLSAAQIEKLNTGNIDPSTSSGMPLNSGSFDKLNTGIIPPDK